MNKNSPESKYQSLLANALSQSRFEYGPSDHVYAVFIDELYKTVLDPYDDIGIIERATENWLKSIIGGGNEKHEFSDYLENLNKNIAINKRQHLLVSPLVESECKSDVVSSTFRIITGTPTEKIQKLVDISGISADEGIFFADHTNKNKEPGFFEENLLVVTQNAHTSSVRFRATELVRLVMYVIRMYYISYVRGTDLDTTKIFRPSTTYDLRHLHNRGTVVAIWADEYYAFSHEYLREEVDFRFNIDFILAYVREIESFVSNVVFNINRNDFGSKMLNALIVGNKAFHLERNFEPNVALLLLVSTVESLLCEGRGEKKLRFAALLPRMSGISRDEIGATARDLSTIYNSRNQFVHAAEEQNLHTLLQKDRTHPLILVSRLLGRLIFMNFDPKNEKTLDEWNKQIDTRFESLIY